MTPLTLLVLLLSLASLAFTWVCGACVLRVRKQRRIGGDCPAISVLKPLKGADRDLYANLASLARQDYPVFELVFACEEISDPALTVVRQLKKEFPHVAISVVAGGKPIGFNPKVNNLHQATSVARYDTLLVSDADVRVDEQYLRALAAELTDPRVDLVSNPVAGVGERTLGSALDNLHLNTFVVSSVCGAQIMKAHACVVGKSILMRKSALDAIGGWARVKDVLAEDYMLGQLFQQARLGVALSPYVVRAVNRRRTVEDFMARHVRWGQMRRKLAGALYWFEPLMMPNAWLLLALGLLTLEPRTPSMIVAAWGVVGLLGLKAMTDAVLIKLLRGQWPSRLGFAMLPFKDVLVVGTWLSAALRDTVQWRGNRFKINAGSVLSPLYDESAEKIVVAGL